MFMFKIFRTALLLTFYAFLCLGCHTPQTMVKKDFESSQLNSRNPEDSQVVRMIAPYKQQLDLSMNEIVGRVENTLYKETPEGSLNNFIADAVLAFNNEPNYTVANCCVLNLGGIRLNELPAGELTVGKCFELLPFENKLVVLKITGLQLQQLLDLAALNKGWPIAGIRMKMTSSKAYDITIQGEALDSSKIYMLLTNDYMANGGDNCSMLTKSSQRTSPYTMRDALIQYCRNQTQQNKPLTAVKDGRIK